MGASAKRLDRLQDDFIKQIPYGIKNRHKKVVSPSR
jgi:hypothetical protein